MYCACSNFDEEDTCMSFVHTEPRTCGITPRLPHTLGPTRDGYMQERGALLDDHALNTNGMSGEGELVSVSH